MALLAALVYDVIDALFPRPDELRPRDDPIRRDQPDLAVLQGLFTVLADNTPDHFVHDRRLAGLGGTRDEHAVVARAHQDLQDRLDLVLAVIGAAEAALGRLRRHADADFLQRPEFAFWRALEVRWEIVPGPLLRFLDLNLDLKRIQKFAARVFVLLQFLERFIVQPRDNLGARRLLEFGPVVRIKHQRRIAQTRHRYHQLFILVRLD